VPPEIYAHSYRHHSKKRTGLVSATSVGGMDKSEDFYKEFINDNKAGKLIDVVTHDCGESTEKIADYLGIKDYITTISTACSSSANSIMFGARLIKNGILDRVVCGGTDSLTKFTLNGFNTLMILDKDICKPFDDNRNGLTIGEGAGFVVLESEESVSLDNKKILCELTGYNNSCDAFHQTASSPDGYGAYLAMKGAIDMSRLSIDEIDYIDSAIKDSFTPIILRLLHNLNKDDLQMIEKKAMSFDINQTPFEEYYINLQKLLEPSSYFTLPEIDRKDISDEEWVQLKKRLLDIATNIFPNRTKEQKISFKNIFQRKRLAKFFDLIMETRDVKLFGLQKIRKRIAYIIDHIEKDAEAEKMKLLTILVEGGKACSDRCMQTIEEVELEMILNSLDPNDANQAIIELVVCRWKREKINEIVANIDRRDENIESGIYYSLLLNDRFGLNMNSQTMQFSVEANKALLPNLIEQFFDSTSSESFLTSMLYSPTFDQKVLKPLLDKEQETEGTELYKLAMDADEKYEEKKEQFKHIQALQAFRSAGYLEKRKNEANHKDKRRRIDEIVVK